MMLRLATPPVERAAERLCMGHGALAVKTTSCQNAKRVERWSAAAAEELWPVAVLVGRT